MAAPEHRPRPLLREGDTSRNWLLGTALAILALWALHAAGSVSVLVLGGLFAALLVAPLDRKVQSAMPGRFGWVGHVAALLALLLGLAILAGALLFCATQVASEFRTLAEQGLPGSRGGARDGESSDASGLSDLLARFDLQLSSLISRAVEQLSGTITVALSSAAAIVTGIVLVVFIALMMLVDAPRWRGRLGHATDRSGPWITAFSTLGIRVRRFAVIRLLMGIITAALYGAWLWIFGVDLIWTWMILTVILTFVPTLGSIVSGVLPTIYAAFTKDVGTAIAVGAGLLAIEQVIGNFVDPKIAGEQVAVSPLVVLIGLLVWGFVLGAVGTLLATPITLAIIILGARIEPLRSLALMLSNCEDWDDFDRMTTP
jgi:AI-2 transport protein TqsA